jgi:hypothetical protein
VTAWAVSAFDMALSGQNETLAAVIGLPDSGGSQDSCGDPPDELDEAMMWVRPE